jgi:hypothetical protein
MSAVNDKPAVVDLTTPTPAPAPKSIDPVAKGVMSQSEKNNDKYAAWPGWATVESEPVSLLPI